MNKNICRDWCGARLTAILLAATILFGGGCAADRGGRGGEIRNVLVIGVDTLRADFVGAYGGPEGRTPNADRLAGKGALFERCFVASNVTLPSFSSIMTGRYPIQTGVTANGVELPDSETTMAEAFREAGHGTAAFVSSSILDSRYGLVGGFQTYDDEMTKPSKEGTLERAAEDTTGRAVSWLEKNGGGRFFLFVHYFDPHMPYEAYSGRYRNMAAFERGFVYGLIDRKDLPGLKNIMSPLRDYYGQEVRHVDESIGRLLETLDRLGLEKNTLVVLTSDHGEELFEHFMYPEHVASLYNSVTRVPLAISAPGKKPAAARIGNTVSSVDIMPTVLELAGLKVPAGIAGKSLVPLIEGEGEPGERAAFTLRPPAGGFAEGQGYSVVRGKWKYIYYEKAPGRLFDLDEDPGERNDLSGTNPVLKAQLQNELAAWYSSRAADRKRKAGPETEKMLKELGYIK